MSTVKVEFGLDEQGQFYSHITGDGSVKNVTDCVNQFADDLRSRVFDQQPASPANVQSTPSALGPDAPLAQNQAADAEGNGDVDTADLPQ